MKLYANLYFFSASSLNRFSTIPAPHSEDGQGRQGHLEVQLLPQVDQPAR